MALVRSNDALVLVEYFVESTYGDDGTYPTGYKRFPFAGEDLHIEQDTIPPSEEFTAFGGISSVDIGKRVIKGSITIEPSYDAIWFWGLFGNAFSYENKVADINCLGTTVVTPDSTNLHVFHTGQILKSFTINVWKAGVGPAASGYTEIYTGCKVTSWTWEQPENGRAKVVLNFVGKERSAVLSNTLNSGTPTTQESPYKKFKSTDLLSTRPAGKILFGDGSTDPLQLNLTAFTISCDKKVDDTAPPFLPSVTTANEPSIEGNREITLSITSNLEMDFAAAKKPMAQWGNLGASSVVIIYDSGEAISTSPTGNYSCRIDMPSVRWTEMRNNITGPGVVQLTGTGMCEQASTAKLGIYDAITGLTAKTVDMRIMTHVLFTDEPTSDSKFTSLADLP